MISFYLNYLLKGLSLLQLHSEVLEARTSTFEFVGDTYSDYNICIRLLDVYMSWEIEFLLNKGKISHQKDAL